jgi:hypothetical protein
VVTGGLPAAARRNATWWSNELAARAPQSRAWLAAGFLVGDTDLTAGTVHLVRAATPARTR